MAGFVPWAGQLGFFMLTSARCELGRPSFIPKSLDGKRRNSLFSELCNFQYLATDWVIGKILEYWFLGFSPSSFPPAVLSVRGTMSYAAKAPRCLGNQDYLTPENTVRLPWACQGGCGATVPSSIPISSFCSCTCVCRNDVLEEVIERAGGGGVQRSG